MTWKMMTAIIVLAGPPIILIYDLLAAQFGGKGATLTAEIQRLSRDWPELPALSGALFVWLWLHLFLNGIVARVNEHLPPGP